MSLPRWIRPISDARGQKLTECQDELRRQSEDLIVASGAKIRYAKNIGAQHVSKRF